MNSYVIFTKLVFLVGAAVFLYFGIKLIMAGEHAGGWTLTVFGAIAAYAGLFAPTTDRTWITIF